MDFENNLAQSNESAQLFRENSLERKKRSQDLNFSMAETSNLHNELFESKSWTESKKSNGVCRKDFRIHDAANGGRNNLLPISENNYYHDPFSFEPPPRRQTMYKMPSVDKLNLAQVQSPVSQTDSTSNYNRLNFNRFVGDLEFLVLSPILSAIAIDLLTHNKSFPLTRGAMGLYGKSIHYGLRKTIEVSPKVYQYVKDAIKKQKHR